MRRRDLWATSSTNVCGAEYVIYPVDAMTKLQLIRVVISICSYYRTIWDGSSILDPIIKFHAVGQKKRIYIVISITVYNEVAILRNLWNCLQIAE